MPKDRSLVRASDIGLWSFCNRAWWLAHVEAAPPENPEALAAGTRAHAAHGRSLHRSTQMARVGLLLCLIGLGLFALFLLFGWPGS